MRYQLRRSRRARYMRLTIYPGGTLVVTAPPWCSTHRIERFLAEQAAWIAEKLEALKEMRPLPRAGRREYLALREAARRTIRDRVQFWNKRFGFPYGRVAIKNHRSLWGSASVKRNLNFNFRLVLLPPELLDYVVVHELCHLKEQNHSAAFWSLVRSALPDYRALRNELRRYRAGSR